MGVPAGPDLEDPDRADRHEHRHGPGDGFSVRSIKHYDGVRQRVLDNLIPAFITPRAEQRARLVQKELVRRGQHRAVAVPDLLVAAVAEVERLTVLHYDADFELIASVTGQPTEWVVKRGSID